MRNFYIPGAIIAGSLAIIATVVATRTPADEQRWQGCKFQAAHITTAAVKQQIHAGPVPNVPLYEMEKVAVLDVYCPNTRPIRLKAPVAPGSPPPFK